MKNVEKHYQAITHYGDTIRNVRQITKMRVVLRIDAKPQLHSIISIQVVLNDQAIQSHDVKRTRRYKLYIIILLIIHTRRKLIAPANFLRHQNLMRKLFEMVIQKNFHHHQQKMIIAKIHR